MPLNVLIVDDSPIVRTVIRKALSICELPVTEMHEAADGRQALDIMGDNWIDVVFADIHMPVMTGIEMVEAMSADEVLSEIPVVVVSTEGDATRMEHLMRHGVKAYLRKPITPEQILHVVQDVVGHKLVSSHAHTLAESVRDVLERMAFTFPEQIDASELPDPDDDRILRAAISFSGHATGELAIAAPEQLCRRIAADVLGEENPGPDAPLEVLKELANVVCGDVASSISDGQYPIDLGTPDASRIDLSAWMGMKTSSGAESFVLDGAPLVARLELREASMPG